MTKLGLRENWQRLPDKELQKYIETTQRAVHAATAQPGQTWQYLARLYSARLIMLRAELLRRSLAS